VAERLSAVDDEMSIALVDAPAARRVVETAIALISAGFLDRNSGYPGLSSDDKTEFETWLRSMP
jgi:hypothetical protein